MLGIAATFAFTVAEGCHSPRDGRATDPIRSAKPSLAQVLERGLASFQAETGVFVKHLGTKEEAGIRADRPFNAFSVIKLAIMVRAHQLADQGLLDLDERVAVRESDLRPGSGMLYVFDPGVRLTVRDLITQMIATSDNGATDMMLERVGGLAALNAWLADSGFGATRMALGSSGRRRSQASSRE